MRESDTVAPEPPCDGLALRSENDRVERLAEQLREPTGEGQRLQREPIRLPAGVLDERDDRAAHAPPPSITGPPPRFARAGRRPPPPGASRRASTSRRSSLNQISLIPLITGRPSATATRTPIW